MLPADDDELLAPIPIVTARLELTTFTLRAMRATLGTDLARVAEELDAEVPPDLRERLGISSFMVGDMDLLAPVVERLRGT